MTCELDLGTKRVTVSVQGRDSRANQPGCLAEADIQLDIVSWVISMRDLNHSGDDPKTTNPQSDGIFESSDLVFRARCQRNGAWIQGMRE
jgi:hypothetical protein